MNSQTLTVAVIGAGPVGLAAVAHLLERGETPILFEAGDEVAANMREWSHVRMFSPWEFTVDAASVRLLEKHGWQMPTPDDLPTGGDLRERYLLPFAALPEVREHLHLSTKVTAITRRDIDKMKDTGRDNTPFVLHVIDATGQECRIEARAVIDASGTWHQPNPLGAGGLPAIGERRHADRIAYGIPDMLGTAKARYADKRVMVVGSGHSAINAVLDLLTLIDSAPQTRVLWAMRGTNLKRVFGGGEDDALEARGKLGLRIQSAVESGRVEIVSPFRVQEIRDGIEGLDVIGETPDGLQTVTVDEVVTATGARPDLAMLRELRLDLDSSLESTRQLAPMIDPNIHSCGTVRPHGEAELRHPEKDFYIVGMKSYGRAPTFLLATGYEQVRSVVAALVGDWEAARDVRLNLPETGVCNSDLDGSCCAPTPVQAVTLSLNSITVNGDVALKAAPVSTTDCGCADDCCEDGVRSTACGCDTACCS